MQSSTTTLENCLWQYGHILTISSSVHAPWHLFIQRNWKHENLHLSICISSVYDCPPWKQSNSPSVYEWISKLWNIQTVECYLALTINEPSSHEKTWRNLVCIFLSERSHSEKATYSVTLMIWHSEKRHNQRSVVTRD